MPSKAKSRQTSGAEKQEIPENEKPVGKVAHYYTKLGVAAIDLTGPLKVGDEIHILGHTSDFTQKVDSMQIKNKPVEEAKKGKAIGLKIKEHARENDAVYKVE